MPLPDRQPSLAQAPGNGQPVIHIENIVLILFILLLSFEAYAFLLTASWIVLRTAPLPLVMDLT